MAVVRNYLVSLHTDMKFLGFVSLKLVNLLKIVNFHPNPVNRKMDRLCGRCLTKGKRKGKKLKQANPQIAINLETKKGEKNKNSSSKTHNELASTRRQTNVLPFLLIFIRPHYLLRYRQKSNSFQHPFLLNPLQMDLVNGEFFIIMARWMRRGYIEEVSYCTVLNNDTLRRGKKSSPQASKLSSLSKLKWKQMKESCP